MDKSSSFLPQMEQSAEFKALSAHFLEIEPSKMRDMFSKEENRFQQFNLQAAGLNLDYSKNRINQTTVKLLTKLAVARDLPSSIQAMFSGECINQSENRPALHTA